MAGAVVGRDGDVVAGALSLLPLLLLDPPPAAPTPSTATQAIAATRCRTFLTVVPLSRFICPPLERPADGMTAGLDSKVDQASASEAKAFHAEMLCSTYPTCTNR